MSTVEEVELSHDDGDNLLTVTDFVLCWYPMMPPSARQAWAFNSYPSWVQLV